MAGLLTERKPFLLLLVLLTLNLVLMSSRVRSDGRGTLLEEAVLSLGAPFLKAASWAAGSSVRSWKAYMGLRGVERENRRFREEIRDLSAKMHDAEEALQEARRLRDLLDLREQLAYPSVAARVIGRRAAGGAKILLLDRGSGDGIRPNQPVVTPRGTVGRVIEVSPGISKVQTVLDPNSGVAALLMRTRVQGVVVGEGERGCRMDYVSELSHVEVGDVVITSGLDQIHPKGSIIGVVSAIGEGEGLTKIIEVRPEVDFLRLEEVVVLLKPEGPPARETR
ncbi:MAG: rod shape-determining protein MreC [Acidobacteria bacterium]|nr:rod shape-determining protein MreC [Acidobacteriota bacterium]